MGLSKTAAAIAFAIVATLTATKSLQAQANDFWINAGTGNYHTGSNWADGSPAGALDHAFFDGNGNYQVRWINSGGDTFSRSLRVRNGGVRFFNNGAEQLSQHHVQNNLAVDSGSLEISNLRMTIVDALVVSEVLEINSGSTISVLQDIISSHVTGDNSNVTFAGDGTTVEGGESFLVGRRGASFVTLDNNAELNLEIDLTIGSALPENNSSFVISGGASAEAVGSICVAGAGSNTLDILDGSATAQHVEIGSNDFVSLSGETALLASDTLAIGGPEMGGSEAGVLNVFSGGTVTTNSTANNNVVLGLESDSRGTATVNGALSSWTIQGAPMLGALGHGEITVANGGTVACGAGVTELGSGPSGVGEIAVSGDGSLFDCDLLHVGADGSDAIASGVILQDSGRLSANSILVDKGFVAVEGGELDSTGIGVNGTLYCAQSGTASLQSLLINEAGFVSVLDDSTLATAGETTAFGFLAVRGQGIISVGSQLGVAPNGRLEMTGSTPRIESASIYSEGTIDITASNAAIQGNIVNRGDFVKSGGGAINVFGSFESTNTDSMTVVDAGNSMAVHGRFACSDQIYGGGSVFVLNELDPGGDDVDGITFQGNLQLRPTSTTNVQIAGINDLDFIDTVGAMDIQGGVLNVEFVNGFVPVVGDSFSLSFISVSGGLTGEFAGLPDGAIVTSVGSVDLVIDYNYANNSISIDAVTSTQNLIQSNSLTVFRGIANGGGLTEILDSEDQTANFLPGFTLNANEAPVWLVVEGSSPILDPNFTLVSIESQANTPGIRLNVEAFNFTTNQFDARGQADVSFNTDNIYGVTFLPNLEDYINADGLIRTRFGFRQTGFTILFPWEIKVDRVQWQVE